MASWSLLRRNRAALLQPLRISGILGFSTVAKDLESTVDTRISELKKRQEASASTIAPRNFSFSGCGFLLPYHIGVSHALQEIGYLTPSSRVAGASGGALIAAALAANIDLHLILEDATKMATFGRASGTWGNLEPSLRLLFSDRFAGLDVESLDGRLTVATQQVWPKRETVLHDSFHSTEDLCDALIASCFIPFYLSKNATSKFRGEFHVDGGLVKLVPEVPDHVRVCAFQADLLRRDDYEISPSLDAQFPYSIWQLLRWSLLPAEPEVMEELFQLGRKSATLWMEKKVEQEEKATQ